MGPVPCKPNVIDPAVHRLWGASVGDPLPGRAERGSGVGQAETGCELGRQEVDSQYFQLGLPCPMSEGLCGMRPGCRPWEHLIRLVGKGSLTCGCP